MKSTIITGVMAATILLAGCSKNVSSGSSSASQTAQADAILKPALTAWQQGDKVTAVSSFLAADWSSHSSFAAGSTLSLSKDGYHALSDADRRAKSIQVLGQLETLRDLSKAVDQAGRDAASKGDATQARKCFKSLIQCGTALDSPDVMQIVQLTGKATKKMGDKGMTQIGQ
jgi:hypothetical protein